MTAVAGRRAAGASWPPRALRDYAFLADGERGALIGPDGAIVWLCVPRWDSPPVFAALIGGAAGTRSPPPIPGTSGAATTSRAA